MTGTGAERVPTDHLSTPPLMGNRWKGRGQDEQSDPRPPAWVLLPSPPPHHLKSSPCLGSCRGSSREQGWGLEGREGPSPSSTSQKKGPRTSRSAVLGVRGLTVTSL